MPFRMSTVVDVAMGVLPFLSSRVRLIGLGNPHFYFIPSLRRL